MPFIGKCQNYIPFSKEAPLELGQGFNIADPTQLRIPFLENPNPKDDGQGANTIIDFKLIETKESFNELFNRDISFHARFLFTKIAGHFNINEEYLNSSRYKTLVFIGKSEFGNQSVGSFKLSPEAKQLIDEKKYDDFIDRYGSHFVQKVSRGVCLYVFVTVDMSYYSSTNGNSYGGSAGGKIIGGEIEVRNFLNQQRGRNSIAVKIFSNGPDNFGELSRNIVTAANSTNIDVFDAIKTGISDCLSRYNKSNSYITGYFYSPMSLFGVPKEKIQWSDTKEKKLLEIKEEFESIEYFTKSINEFKAHCVYLNAKQNYKDSLNTALAEIYSYQDSLKKSHERCLNLNNSEKSCDFISPDEGIANRLIDPIKSILTLSKTSLAYTELKSGNEFYWTFENKCYNGEPISVNFSGIIAKSKLWALFDIYLDLDFMINDQVIYNYKGSKSGSQEIKFEERLYNGSPGKKGIKFTIRVNKCTLKTLGEDSGTNSVPLEDGKIDLKLNLNIN